MIVNYVCCTGSRRVSASVFIRKPAFIMRRKFGLVINEPGKKGSRFGIQIYKKDGKLKKNPSLTEYFDSEAVDCVDKYFQIGSGYYFIHSDSGDQIGYRGFFLF